MKFPLSTSKLASFSSRRPWIVVALWVVLLISAAI
jgi:uncharacterized membrane protein YdfJ with MMPL/SSD domain